MCRCDCRYVGQTSRRLQNRIHQRIPRRIRSDKRPTKRLPNREWKSLAPLVSTVILQPDSIYLRMKNVPNISTMYNFPFWLQQDLRFIYQFWKQPTSVPYSLFFAVKTPNFTLIFFFSFFWRNRNNIFPPIKLPEWPILTNQSTTRNFLYFCFNLIQF